MVLIVLVTMHFMTVMKLRTSPFRKVLEVLVIVHLMAVVPSQVLMLMTTIRPTQARKEYCLTKLKP